MRFESFMWAVLSLILAGAAAWEQTPIQPLQTEEHFEAKDGGNKIPPD